MKFRKVMLVTFVLLAILTIGVVSAFDESNDLTAQDLEVSSDNLKLNEVDSYDYISDDINIDEIDFYVNEDEINISEENDDELVMSVTVFDEFADENAVINITGVDYCFCKNLTDTFSYKQRNLDDTAFVYGITFKDVVFFKNLKNNCIVDFAFIYGDEVITSDKYTFIFNEDENYIKLNLKEDFNFDLDLKNTSSLGFNQEILNIVTPDEGNFTIQISSNGETKTFVHEINEDDVSTGYIIWTLDDLEISNRGLYNISAEYISPAGDETVVFKDFILTVFNITILEEFDVKNTMDIVVSIYCPETTGIIIASYSLDGSEDYIELNQSISSSNWNDYINWTVQDLKITQADYYIFRVFFLNDVDEKADYEDESNMVVDVTSQAIDFDKFVVEVNDDLNYLSKDSVVSVYCPDGVASEITVNVKSEGDDIGKNFTKNISDKDVNKMLYWNITDLELSYSIRYYTIKVFADNDIIENETSCEIYNPISFSEISYLESDDIERVGFVEVEIPTDIAKANIIIFVNGEKKFNKTLNEFNDIVNINNIYWIYVEGLDYLKKYYVNNKNAGFEFSQNIYNISVSVEIDGKTMLTNASNVNLTKSNSISKNNVTITIFDLEKYYFKESEKYIAIINSTEDMKGNIIITIAGNDGFVWNRTFDENLYTIAPYDLGLNPGNYNMTVAFLDKNNVQLVNKTSLITLLYGEEGIMMADVSSRLRLDDNEAIRIWFDTFNIEEISGDIVIKFDDVTYFTDLINSTNFKYQWDEVAGKGEYYYFISPLMFNNTIPLGYFDKLEILYHGNDGITGNYIYDKGINVIPPEPVIYIMYSEWESQKAKYNKESDNLVYICPNGDNLSSVRIILTVDGEEYLNTTLTELNLISQSDEQSNVYYTLGPVNFNKTVDFGHYSNVVAYYISENYKKDTKNDDTHPNFFDVVGVLDEIEYNDTTSPIVAILCDQNNDQIVLNIMNNKKEFEKNITYTVSSGDFGKILTWNLADLNLSIGNYYIEAYLESNILYEGELSVVNNSQYRIKAKCDWIYTNNNVFYIYSPQGSVGTVKVTGDCINTLESEIISGGYVGFTLSQLGITKPDTYVINVSVNGESICVYDLEIDSPMEFNGNNIAVIPNEGDKNDTVMRIVSLKLPVNATGQITVAIDGDSQKFDLTSIKVENLKDSKYYTIYVSDLNKNDEGKHLVSINYADITETRNISFNKRNIKTQGNVSIEMFSSKIDVDDTNENYFAIVTSPLEYASIHIIIDNNAQNIDLNTLLKENIRTNDGFIGYKYYIQYKDINNIDFGKHNVTLIYYNDTSEVIKNNDTIKIFKTPEIFIPYTGEGEVKHDLDSDNMIYIYNYGEDLTDIRIIVKIGDEEYLNSTLKDLNLTAKSDSQSEKYYSIGPVNFMKNIIPNHYDNVIAYYISEDYEINTPHSSVDIYGNSSVELNNIEFKYGDIGNTTINVIGGSISKDNINVDKHPEANITLENNIIYISNLTVGIFTLKVKTTPNTNYYYSVEKTVNITVSKINSSISFKNNITFDYGDVGNATFEINGATIGEDSVSVANHPEVIIKVNNNVISVSNLTAGSYILNVVTIPDEVHLPVTTTLNITVNKINSKIIFDKDNITFDYNTIGNINYTLTGGSISEANASVISHSEAIVKINDRFISVSNLTAGSYTLNITITPDENHISISKTIDIIVNKIDSSVKFDYPIIFVYGEIGNTTLTVNGGSVSKDNIVVDNHPEANITLENNIIYVSNLTAGSYTLNVTTDPDENYNQAHNSIEITVNKANSSVDFSNNIVFIKGKSGNTTITVIGGNVSEANISIINHPEAKIILTDNVIQVSNLTNGNYVLKVTTNPDENHNSVTVNVNVTVSLDLINPNFNIEIDDVRLDSLVVINVTAVDTFTGDVNVEIGGKNISINIVNGFGTNQSYFDVGSYNAVLNFTEDNVFKSAYVNKTFEVKVALVDPDLIVSVLPVSLGEDVVVIITTNTSFIGNVSVKIDDDEKNALIVNGSGNVSFTINSAGSYVVFVTFNETEIFTASEKNTTVIVNKLQSGLNVVADSIYEGNDIIVVITTNSAFSGNVSVKIGGDEKIAEIINGSGNAVFKGYGKGSYIINAKFNETDKFKADEINRTVEVNVKPVDPNLAINIASITQGANVVVKITTNNTFTGKVSVKIANINYNVDVKDGYGTVIIFGFGVGTYTATATFKATDIFISSVKSKTFSVNKKADVISISLKTVKVKKSAKKLILQATLKINNVPVKGKQIVFKFNGKTLKAKTNPKGIAKVIIKKAVLKKLKVGKKITYQAKYSTKTIKKVVKVKK